MSLLAAADLSIRVRVGGSVARNATRNDAEKVWLRATAVDVFESTVAVATRALALRTLHNQSLTVWIDGRREQLSVPRAAPAGGQPSAAAVAAHTFCARHSISLGDCADMMRLLAGVSPQDE